MAGSKLKKRKQFSKPNSEPGPNEPVPRKAFRTLHSTALSAYCVAESMGAMGLSMDQPVTQINAIGDNLYRISTAVPPETVPGGFTFNQYLLIDDAPLLFHTGCLPLLFNLRTAASLSGAVTFGIICYPRTYPRKALDTIWYRMITLGIGCEVLTMEKSYYTIGYDVI